MAEAIKRGCLEFEVQEVLHGDPSPKVLSESMATKSNPTNDEHPESSQSGKRKQVTEDAGSKHKVAKRKKGDAQRELHREEDEQEEQTEEDSVKSKESQEIQREQEQSEEEEEEEEGEAEERQRPLLKKVEANGRRRHQAKAEETINNKHKRRVSERSRKRGLNLDAKTKTVPMPRLINPPLKIPLQRYRCTYVNLGYLSFWNNTSYMHLILTFIVIGGAALFQALRQLDPLSFAPGITVKHVSSYPSEPSKRRVVRARLTKEGTIIDSQGKVHDTPSEWLRMYGIHHNGDQLKIRNVHRGHAEDWWSLTEWRQKLIKSLEQRNNIN